MISDFFTTSFTVKRPTWKTDGQDNEYTEKEEAGAFLGHLQQAQAELVQNLGLSFTKAYSVWCAFGTDVKEGDTIVAGDVSYSVRAKRDHMVGSNEHVELVVELDEVAEA